MSKPAGPEPGEDADPFVESLEIRRARLANRIGSLLAQHWLKRMGIRDITDDSRSLYQMTQISGEQQKTSI